MTDTSKTDPEISQELDALAAIIRRAERDLAEDKLLAIGDLPERTQAVCNRVADLPKEEGSRFESRLAALINELDTLGQNISQRQEQLVDLLAELDGQNDTAGEGDQT
jgi:DNA-binding ferritin-like protein